MAAWSLALFCLDGIRAADPDSGKKAAKGGKTRKN